LFSIVVGYIDFKWFVSATMNITKHAPHNTLINLLIIGYMSSFLSILIMGTSRDYSIFLGPIIIGIINMIIGFILFVINALLHTQFLHECFHSFEITLIIAFFLMGYLSHSLYQKIDFIIA
jgi:hypothetical protein